MKINVYGTESFTTFVVREPVEVETDNYPELVGMTEEEAKEYIRKNASEMKPSEGQDWFDSLFDECRQSDVRREKINEDGDEIIFDGE
jgi:hypothetical protein